jgi:integrase
MCIGLFCATRTSETFGLQWKSYRGDRLMIESTAYEGELYRGQVKTKASRNSVPIPNDIIPIVEARRQLCPDTSAEALMFPTFGRKKRKSQKVPRRAKNFLKWRIYPIADRLKIPRELVTFQVMRRTLGTDLQKHGTMKDAQGALRHASIKSTADVYMQEIPASVRAAINSRTHAILAMQSAISPKAVYATCPNVSKLQEATLASA